MKYLQMVMLVSFVLASCSAPVRPTAAPLVERTQPAGVPTEAVREVTLVPATPDQAAVTTPTPEPITQMPKTLEEQGIPSSTYQDSSAGLAFDYPSTWLLSEPVEEAKQTAGAYTVTLISGERPAGEKMQEGIPAGMSTIDVTVIRNAPVSLEEVVKERRAVAAVSPTGRPVTIQSEEDWGLPGGLQAHRFLLNLGSPAPGTRDEMAAELVTIINGQTVLVTGLGDLSLFNTIASSLRDIQ